MASLSDLLTVASYSLGAALIVLALFAGHLAIWRHYWHGASIDVLHELRMKVQELEFAVLSLADQYEQSVRINSAKLGKLRRALARERGEDEDDDEEQQQAPAAVPAPEGNSRDQLFARARSKGLQ